MFHEPFKKVATLVDHFESTVREYKAINLIYYGKELDQIILTIGKTNPINICQSYELLFPIQFLQNN